LGKFKVGNPKPANSGRKKGTPNKKSFDFSEKLRELNFDPAAEMVWCYKQLKSLAVLRSKKGNLIGSITALQAAEKTANDISQYVFPKKKAIEHTGELGIKTFADFIAAGEDDEAED
jgi:hypothetical protein